MPGPKKVDWKELERLSVVENKSDREIARMYGLSNATVSAKHRADDWTGKRLAYTNAMSRRSYEKVAESVANEQAEITKESVLAARLYIRKFIGELNAGTLKTNAKDAATMIGLLVGSLAAPSEEKTDTPVILEQTPDVDVLRRILETAREHVADPGSVGPGVLVNAPASRPN